ncbi:MAG TPA: hypothetical protein VE075_03860, partial [Thermoanaerobaculia bacterium]|nr:hypothetical protein [Thermoanaerobaculia bacterium]
ASIALLLGTLLAALPLAADDVYLKNGRSFENVVAEVGDTQVRVHMPGGVISLPRSSVDRVSKADSSFAEYSRRKQQLEGRERAAGEAGPAAGLAGGGAGRWAAEWLELARWARSNNLPQGVREAALQAAEINPREPGLSGLLRGFGYVYEESLDRWIPYDDAMRLHGFVQDGGTWVSREEHAERVRAQAEARAQAAVAARAEAAAARDLMAAEMMQAQLAAAQPGGYGYGAGGNGQFLGGFYGGFGGAYWPFGVPGFGARREHGERGERHHGERRGEHGASRAPRTGDQRSTVFGVPGPPHAERPPGFVH